MPAIPTRMTNNQASGGARRTVGPLSSVDGFPNRPLRSSPESGEGLQRVGSSPVPAARRTSGVGTKQPLTSASSAAISSIGSVATGGIFEIGAVPTRASLPRAGLGAGLRQACHRREYVSGAMGFGANRAPSRIGFSPEWMIVGEGTCHCDLPEPIGDDQETADLQEGRLRQPI
jgi:hypothetical protein